MAGTLVSKFSKGSISRGDKPSASILLTKNKLKNEEEEDCVCVEMLPNGRNFPFECFRRLR